MKALSRCRESGDFSDLTLLCAGEEFKVHKVIVCSQSNVLRAACADNSKEASTGIYKFEDEPAIIVKQMIEFFYCGDDNDPVNESTSLSRLQLHAKVFALADRYCVPDLANLCCKKFKKRLEMKEPTEFLESIPSVYSSTPDTVRGLRDIVTSFAHVHVPTFVLDPSFETAYKKVEALFLDFEIDLLSLFTQNVSNHCCTCADETKQDVKRLCKECRRQMRIERFGW